MANAQCTLAPDALNAAAEQERFARSTSGEGAIASFTGIVRSAAEDGGAVTRLFLDHHPRLTLASLDEIAAAALARFPIANLRIVHRCGEVIAGEEIVFVAAAAAHRRAALEAVDFVMDHLKTDAVFWKREDGADGARWIEPTDADHIARAHWEE